MAFKFPQTHSFPSCKGPHSDWCHHTVLTVDLAQTRRGPCQSSQSIAAPGWLADLVAPSRAMLLPQPPWKEPLPLFLPDCARQLRVAPLVLRLNHSHSADLFVGVHGPKPISMDSQVPGVGPLVIAKQDSELGQEILQKKYMKKSLSLSPPGHSSSILASSSDGFMSPRSPSGGVFQSFRNL
jgi:hypothetical protein